MKRRDLLSSLALSTLGIISLPSWANAWQGKNLKGNPLRLQSLELTNLDQLAETIIPETKTPGAKTLEIAKFINKMIADTYIKADQDKFKVGLQKIEELSNVVYGSTFEKTSNAQKIHMLEGMKLSTDTNQKWFYNTLKGLSVWAYTSSEYYMTTIDKFEFAPARYSGCVPLTQY